MSTSAFILLFEPEPQPKAALILPPSSFSFHWALYNVDSMAMGPDDHVCYCFHVSLRKIENFCRNTKPQHASQISECLSAGTGCGWCVPLLRKIHKRTCGGAQPWWRQTEDAAPETGSANDYASAEDYAAARQAYIQKKNSPQDQKKEDPSATSPPSDLVEKSGD